MLKDIKIIREKLGRPLICVPIVDNNEEAIMHSCEAIKEEPADIVEWRIDNFENNSDIEQVVEVLGKIKKNIGELPLICTFRTHHEGGGFIEDEQYLLLLTALAETGNADYIDVEIKRCSHNAIRQLIKIIRQNGSGVITSCHYFEYTPEDSEMEGILKEMSETDADILKLAVMPKNRRDVIRLISITELASERYDRPVITMSMGRLGLASRVIGGLTGSVITFASVGKASAPGQIPAKDMARIFELI